MARIANALPRLNHGLGSQFMAGGEFDKDFGYLIPFIDKITEAAKNVAETAAREELLELVGGQQQRWARIRELLSGAAAGPAPPVAAGKAEDAISKRMAETRAAKQSFTGAEARAFTVGSLRPRRS